MAAAITICWATIALVESCCWSRAGAGRVAGSMGSAQYVEVWARLDLPRHECCLPACL